MATPKLKVKLRSTRKWLEKQGLSDSYAQLTVNTDSWSKGEVTLKLADCNRSIEWYFGKPGDKRAIAKIIVVKNLVDRIYDYLTQEVEE